MDSFCVVGGWRIVDGRLVVAMDGRIQTFRIVATPRFARSTFDAIVDASDLQCRPRLVWLENAGGHGGFYSPGLIAVGAADQLELANTVYSTYMIPLSPEQSAFQRMFDPSSVYSFGGVQRAGIEYVLGHEVGHARQHERRDGLGEVAAECDADAWAGVLGEHFGWDGTLQRYFAHAIGCMGMFCSHPPPDARVECYEHGRDRQRAFAAQQSPYGWLYGA